MDEHLATLIEQAIGQRPTALTPLSGGCVAQVMCVEMLGEISPVVVKHDPTATGALHTEGRMLRYLKDTTSLPTPGVMHCDPSLLVMEHMEGDTGVSPDAESHAAQLLGDLHSHTAESFGFKFDTVIGALHQPNTPMKSWVEFFREHRLLHMAHCAAQAGRLPDELLSRIERFADHLDRFLEEPSAPALIHGDVWSGNVLSVNDRVTAFLDPAIYFADAEIELAFVTLFSTFSRRFFDAYAERHPIRDDFFEVRKEVYNLYPLLVHVRLFGGHYVDSVVSTLNRLGY
jgi:fructosamine-3-kinase